MLYALGFPRNKIINLFYTSNKYTLDGESKKWKTNFEPLDFKRPTNLRATYMIQKYKKILSKGEKLNLVIARKYKKKLKEILIHQSMTVDIQGRTSKIKMVI